MPPFLHYAIDAEPVAAIAIIFAAADFSTPRWPLDAVILPPFFAATMTTLARCADFAALTPRLFFDYASFLFRCLRRACC